MCWKAVGVSLEGLGAGEGKNSLQIEDGQPFPMVRVVREDVVPSGGALKVVVVAPSGVWLQRERLCGLEPRHSNESTSKQYEVTQRSRACSSSNARGPSFISLEMSP